MSPPLDGIVGGGLVAALMTIAFNAYWDTQKEKRTEDWEFRRYRASLFHHSSFGLMEAFFAAKTEIYYLVGSLSTLRNTLQHMETQTEAILKQQSGKSITVADFEEKKNEALQPLRNYNQEQVNIRWGQYEQKMKDLEAKAEAHMNVIATLAPMQLTDRMRRLFDVLTEDYVWDLQNAQRRLALFVEKVPEFQEIQSGLAEQIEVQLGRKNRKGLERKSGHDP